MSNNHEKNNAVPLNWHINENYKPKTNIDMVNDVIDMINASKSFLVISSFFLAHTDIENALIKAASNGVRCYVMFATNVRLQQEGANDEFTKKAYQRHSETLRKLSGKVLIHASNNFHAKIILCDPNTEPRGMLLTANLTHEALGRNQELSVHLTKNEIIENMKILRWAFWEYAENEIIDNKGTFYAYRPLNEITEYECKNNVLQTTPNYKTIKNELIQMINNKTKSIIISCYGWEEGHVLIDKLCELSKQGVAVTVLARPRSQYNKIFIKMKKSGIQIYGFKWLHAKAIMTDTQTMIMTSNIEKNGLDAGFELGILLDDKRAEKIRHILNQWAHEFQYEFKLPIEKNKK